MSLGISKQLHKIFEIGNIEIHKDDIKRVDQTKLLYLTIDESLSWN